ncbi:5620_t:CDS:2, partial [Funneliformis caledonium]
IKPFGDNWSKEQIKDWKTNKEELTRKNAVWTQSVFETIFDVEYLLTKIDTEDDKDEQYKEEKEVRNSPQHSEYASTDKELYDLYQSLENDANFMD